MQNQVGPVGPIRDDAQSKALLETVTVQDGVRANRVPGVRTVLIVLSTRGMVFDPESLRQKVLFSYPEAAVFFRATLGKPIGSAVPRSVDLLIDFTGAGQRERFFHARKLRRMARVAVGRAAGFFRKRLYDRVFDEKGGPVDLLERERWAQRGVLALAGVAFLQTGEPLPDRGKTIALGLPPMQRL